MCTTRAAAAVAALGLAACGGAASNGPTAASGGCGGTAVHNGPRPAWTDSAWADSSPGFRVPYALATGDRAAAFFFADPIRAGHPTNPANKILWVMRLPRRGMPLAISARRLGGGAPTVSISRSADSSPGEIYPSYVDLPRPGCWRLALAWAGHHASIDVRVAPARGASVRAGVPPPLHGVPLTGRTGLRLLVSADPPFVLDVDSGQITRVTGINVRQPLLTVQPVGRDAVLWVDSRSDLGRPQVYLMRHGTTRATRIGAASELAPADRGHALWLIAGPHAHRCALTEVSLAGRELRPPRRVSCSSRLLAVGTGAAVLVSGRRVIAPDTGRTLLKTPSWLWASAGGWALTSASSGPPLRLVKLGGSPVRRLRWPSRIGGTDDAEGAPHGRLIMLDFADPAFRLSSTQVMDAWLLDPLTGRFRHLPDMPAAVGLKATSMAWASGRTVVILAAVAGLGRGRALVAVFKPGLRQLAVRSVRLPDRTSSGSDSFVVW